MLTVERWPQLREPVLVAALTGWVDAGFAGAGAMEALGAQLDGAEQFATLDLTDLLDLQQTRPTARFVKGGLRVIEWPRIALVAGSAGRDVVLVHGPEPSIRWPSVAAEIVDVAQRLGVRQAVTLAGMPALLSHRRPVPVLATATTRALAQESGALRTDYAGPTGMQTVLQYAFGVADIACTGLWAQVPQYVSGSPSPPSVRAVLGRLAELFRLDIDLRVLDSRCDAYVSKVEEGLAQRPDVGDLVRRLETETAQELPSGDELVSEIERFLRDET
jgi:proteasome assembly chaperone (PAC2) family protein